MNCSAFMGILNFSCQLENELEWVESMLKEDSTRTILLMGSGAIDLNVSCGRYCFCKYRIYFSSEQPQLFPLVIY